MDGTVLERNLCFVDTPGYGRGMSITEGVDLVVQYVESQLAKIASLPDMGEGDILSMLSGNGGPQVDVVFYLVLRRKWLHSSYVLDLATDSLERAQTRRPGISPAPLIAH